MNAVHCLQKIENIPTTLKGLEMSCLPSCFNSWCDSIKSLHNYIISSTRKTVKSDNQLRHIRLFVHMEQPDSHWTDFYEILYPGFIWKSVAKIQAHWNPTKKTVGTLNEVVFTFIIISRWMLRMKNILDKSCREN
jgi:hypothetical protein